MTGARFDLDHITRRALLGTIASCIASPSLPTYANSQSQCNIRLGAIRWDAWYGAANDPNSSEYVARHNLDNPSFYYRAPFFATRTSAGLTICGNQSDLDKEIVYASRAGLSYWAFGWYGPQQPMRNGWEYYKLSSNKHMINWCIIIGSNSLALEFPRHDELIAHFSDPNYESVNMRPILFILHAPSHSEMMKNKLIELRRMCNAHSMQNPFVIVMAGDPGVAAGEAQAIGADAISAYVTPAFGTVSYSRLTDAVENAWRTQAATGLAVVPTAMTGWDLRARSVCAGAQSTLGKKFCTDLRGFVVPGTSNEIAAHIRRIIHFIQSNTDSCTPRNGLIYSWDENDEGGSSLLPTYVEGSVDSRIIDAVGDAILSSKC